ncbi:MAG: hypothetical protein Q9159_005845 [Coniocarpon cinnabarinum]
MDTDLADDADGISATMQQEEKRMEEASRRAEEERDKRLQQDRQKDIQGGSKAVDQKFKALEYLLSQSKLYSTIMLNQMQKQEEEADQKDERAQKRAAKKEEMAEKAAQQSQRRSTRKVEAEDEKDVQDTKTNDTAAKTRGRGRPSNQTKSQGRMTDYVKKEDLEGKAGKGASIQQALEDEAQHQETDGVQASDIGVQNLKSARQPDLVSGGMMRKYQLEGLEWLVSLYENGLNGILADEMGLGKTVQTISFLAFLRERGVNGPFLIAAPLSTTSNWVDEFNRWTPDIPVVLYHGSKQEREEIRRKQLRRPGSPDFPVVCTSYEICMNDRKFLSHFGWKFIIIDEGHRIKNLNCRLIRELQSYNSANRLLITGTPLQNNLAELWSLLHFLMPDIFDKLESFESWFDFSALKEEGGHAQILSEERKASLVTSLHAILKPFLLRRVKADVEHSLPKKREYVLFAPLTSEQRELYQEILHGDSRAYLEDKVVETLSRNNSGTATPVSVKSGKSAASVNTKKRKAPSNLGASSPLTPNSLPRDTPNKSAKTSRASTPAQGQRSKRSARRRNYDEVSDAEFFRRLDENGGEEDPSFPMLHNDDASDADDSPEEQDRQATLQLAKKHVAQKKLQNPIMQLRLCCNSPHNFYDPWMDTSTLRNGETVVDEAGNPLPDDNEDYTALVTASGKMRLLDRLLRALLDSKENHRILLFSQFKSQLDILSLYLSTHLDLPSLRIDGSIPASERQEQIRSFNDPNSEARVFLLSTRAGGQGINLAAADTVILFDSDWNPQQDLQAQDRAHRIGQKRNVVVYRLATRGTVEEVLLSKADGKRRLEKLVISKGKFKSWGERGAKSKRNDDAEDEGMDALQRALAEADGERMDFGGNEDATGEELLSERDLETLIDRSEEAYEKAEKGEKKEGGVFQSVKTGKESALLEGLAG